MNVNGVKKDLYKSKEMAEFSRYVAGNIYYKVKVGYDIYEFPIPTVEDEVFNEDTIREVNTIKLSEDLGTTAFETRMRGSDLNRWITKAINNDEFTLIESF
jgi:hypothetical protein